MKTLLEHIEEWYRISLDKVLKTIERKGYVSYTEANNILNSIYQEFVGSYVKKYNVPPFSEEFDEKTFAEFFKKVANIPGMKTVNVPPDEFGHTIIYGFGDEEKIRKKYLKTSRVDFKI
jgi:hypothetical protein